MLYKILAEDGSACHGGSGHWSLPSGESPGAWMPRVEGEIRLCCNGYHLVTESGLLEWLGPIIYEAEGRGDQDGDGVKVAFREGRLIRRLEHWHDRNARLFAADCAARALANWHQLYMAHQVACDVDARSVAAVVAARDYAHGRIDGDALAAAARAAWAAAAWVAAAAAAASASARSAWAAARSASASARSAWAAEAAERTWQHDRLWRYLRGKNPKPVPLP